MKITDIQINGKSISLEKIIKEYGGNKMQRFKAIDSLRLGDKCGAGLITSPHNRSGFLFGGMFNMECYSPLIFEDKQIPLNNSFMKIAKGMVRSPFEVRVYKLVKKIGLQGVLDSCRKWKENYHNIIVNQGIQHILDLVFSGDASANVSLAPYYVALINASSAGETYAAGDTMASHAGWAEDTNYDEATRQAWTEVRSGQSMTNSAAKAVFTMSATTIIAGSALVSDSTKGGTAGILMAEGNFSEGDRSVVDNDVLNVTYTITGADDGV